MGQIAVLRINVSPLSWPAEVSSNVAETIEEFGIDAGSLCLEITERAMVHDIESTQRTLAELKEVGVQIAIDDFGTGDAVSVALEIPSNRYAQDRQRIGT